MVIIACKKEGDYKFYGKQTKWELSIDYKSLKTDPPPILLEQHDYVGYLGGRSVMMNLVLSQSLEPNWFIREYGERKRGRVCVRVCACVHA